MLVNLPSQCIMSRVNFQTDAMIVLLGELKEVIEPMIGGKNGPVGIILVDGG